MIIIINLTQYAREGLSNPVYDPQVCEVEGQTLSVHARDCIMLDALNIHHLELKLLNLSDSLILMHHRLRQFNFGRVHTAVMII